MEEVPSFTNADELSGITLLIKESLTSTDNMDWFRGKLVDVCHCYLTAVTRQQCSFKPRTQMSNEGEETVYPYEVSQT